LRSPTSSAIAAPTALLAGQNRVKLTPINAVGLAKADWLLLRSVAIFSKSTASLSSNTSAVLPSPLERARARLSAAAVPVRIIDGIAPERPLRAVEAHSGNRHAADQRPDRAEVLRGDDETGITIVLKLQERLRA
jgi:hypothetical protein